MSKYTKIFKGGSWHRKIEIGTQMKKVDWSTGRLDIQQRQTK